MGDEAKSDAGLKRGGGASCPTCGETVEPGSKSTPFCSERCRLADLNKWMSGEYRISREMKETDLDELDA